VPLSVLNEIEVATTTDIVSFETIIVKVWLVIKSSGWLLLLATKETEVDNERVVGGLVDHLSRPNVSDGDCRYESWWNCVDEANNNSSNTHWSQINSLKIPNEVSELVMILILLLMIIYVSVLVLLILNRLFWCSVLNWTRYTLTINHSWVLPFLW
jgi:hypothetical protein